MNNSNETDTEIIYEGDLILEEDFKTEKNLIVKGNILGKNEERWNINARNINARDINAWDINAWDINAGDISYYAVCFAYNSIKCKSIQGRRDNSKHFVLDGKIEIKEEKACEKCGRKL